MFYLNTPLFNFEARLAVKRGQQKTRPSCTDRVLYPIALMYSHKAFWESPRFRRNRLRRLGVTFPIPQA